MSILARFAIASGRRARFHNELFTCDFATEETHTQRHPAGGVFLLSESDILLILKLLPASSRALALKH